jgi:iron complex outermembrane receptor protein
MTYRKILATTVSLAAFASFVAPADAEDVPAAPEESQASADDAQVQEVVVTARRRSESLSKVPISVAAFSSDELVSKQILNTGDLVKLTPGLNIVTAGSNANPFITIRGQSRGLAGAGAPGVITYFNEVPMPTYGSLIPTFDMDNIQVLKGPQGTLFGRNAVGGALLTYSKRPTYEFGGYGEASYGNFNTLRVEGAVNIPIVPDKLAVRLAVQSSDTDGYTKTITYAPTVVSRSTFTAQPGQQLQYSPNFDADKSKGVRATVLFEPTSNLHNTTTVDWYRIEGVNNEPFTGGFFPGVTSVYRLPASVLNGLGLGSLLNPSFHCGTSASCDIELAAQQAMKDGPRVQRTDMLPYQVSIIFGVSNTTSYDIFSDMTLKNIVGYRTTANDSNVDIDGTALPIVDATNRVRLKQWTEELQLSGTTLGEKLKYVLGGFYYKQQPNGLGGFQSINTLVFGGLSDSSSANYYSEQSKAVYGQLDYDLSEYLLQGLGITLGSRYTWDSAKGCGYGADYAVINGGQPPLAGSYGFLPSEDQCTSKNFTPDPNASPGMTTADNFSTSSSSPTWTVALNWQATPNTLLYVTSRRGYKAGGYNTPRFIPTVSNLQTYRPETLTDVELGIKTRFDVATMPTTLNFDVYRGKDKDFQYYQSTTGVPTLPSGGFLFNKADLTIEGVEAEFSVRPMTGLTFSANAAYTSVQVDKVKIPASILQAYEDAGAPTGGLQQVTVGNQPKWQTSASVEYILPHLIADADLRFNVDYHFQTNYVNGQLLVPQWHTADGQLTLAGLHDGKVDVTAFVKNMFDRLYAAGTGSSSELTGIQSYNYAPPRTYGASVRYRFN